jgi:hypothetical protein
MWLVDFGIYRCTKSEIADERWNRFISGKKIGGKTTPP